MTIQEIVTKYISNNNIVVSINDRISSTQVHLYRSDDPKSKVNLKTKEDIIDTITVLKQTLKELNYEQIIGDNM
jgi:hypothetical protein